MRNHSREVAAKIQYKNSLFVLLRHWLPDPETVVGEFLLLHIYSSSKKALDINDSQISLFYLSTVNSLFKMYMIIHMERKHVYDVTRKSIMELACESFNVMFSRFGVCCEQMFLPGPITDIQN